MLYFVIMHAYTCSKIRKKSSIELNFLKEIYLIQDLIPVLVSGLTLICLLEWKVFGISSVITFLRNVLNGYKKSKTYLLAVDFNTVYKKFKFQEKIIRR